MEGYFNLSERTNRRNDAKRICPCLAISVPFFIMSEFQKVISYESLYKSMKKARRGVDWKLSIQKYCANYLKNFYSVRKRMLAGKPITKGFVEFNVRERGKKRHIRSVHFSERVVQQSLCDEKLVPELSRHLIYDNGACLKGKGVSFALNRLSVHLQKYYRLHGNSGYILLIDFHGYFDNIAHKPLLADVSKYITDKDTLDLLKDFIMPFGYNKIVKIGNVNYSKAQGNYSGKSLGLGSPISQMCAVFYPNKLDHYAKERLHCKFYGRYMDDIYIIDDSKEHLKEILCEIKNICSLYEITINSEKTNIVKLSHGFTFLKTKFNLLGTGKILKRLERNNVTRMRRKLKKLKAMKDRGEITMPEIDNSYHSWQGYASHKNSHKTVIEMEKLYQKLFEEA